MIMTIIKGNEMMKRPVLDWNIKTVNSVENKNNVENSQRCVTKSTRTYGFHFSMPTLPPGRNMLCEIGKIW